MLITINIDDDDISTMRELLQRKCENDKFTEFDALIWDSIHLRIAARMHEIIFKGI